MYRSRTRRASRRRRLCSVTVRLGPQGPGPRSAVPPRLRLDNHSTATPERFVAAFRSRWRLYARIVGITAVLAVGASLLLPNWYRAQCTLLPPTEGTDSGFGLLVGMIQTSAI